MCVRKVNASVRIERACAQYRFSTGIVLEKSKKILDQYRDGKLISQFGNIDEKGKLERVKRLINEKYKTTFVDKKGHTTGSLDYLIMEVIGTSWADFLIEQSFNLINDMGLYQEDYKTVLDLYYFDKKVRDDDYIMDKLGISRSTYYRRKKEAITIFGLALWLTMIDECVTKNDDEEVG